MLIQCPSCQTEAQLPASREGAKVRCGECGRVYTARPPGTRGSKGPSGLAVGLGIGVVVVAAFVFWLVNRTETVAPPPPPEPEVEPEVEVVDYTGWDSAPVRAVRDLYVAVQERDERTATDLLAAAEVWAFVTNRDADEGAEPVTAGDFAELDELQRVEGLDAVVASVVAGEHEYALTKWNPVDGNVVEQDDSSAVVHVRVDKLDVSEGLETRTMEFRLAQDDDGWRVRSWERWIPPEERRKIARRERGYEKVELSDGSVLYQADPRPLEYDEATPEELRERIDALYEQMIDLDATTEAADARAELIEIGKPAIPKLLTGLYETPLETEDQAIQVNQIVIALREITGEYMGYKPMQLVGSTTGTTEERRQAAIKAWFAWWLREGARFEEKPEEEDLLEGLIELNEREKRELERDQRSGG